MTALSAPVEVAGPAPVRARRRDLEALGVWLATRVGVLLVALLATRLVPERAAGFLTRWDRWDVGLFRKVAEFGYQGRPEHYADRGIEAFFPGLPVVLHGVHLVVPDWTAAGLLVSLVAGGVAAVYLSRLAELDGAPGGLAVGLLALSPYAVFLAAGYSEALFLALALPAWYAARTGSWRLAALLVAGACTVRVNGLFLAVGLAVQYGVTVRRVRPDAAWLLAPFLALFGYAAYLHALTGDWLRWQHAQTEGWDRRFTLPWDAFTLTFRLARTTQQTDFLWSWRAEVVAVLVGVLLTAVLVRQQRWGEATYVGLSVLALATSTYYLSVARATLLWFPLWLLLARGLHRRPVLTAGYLALTVPLMAVLVGTFTLGFWVD